MGSDSPSHHARATFNNGTVLDQRGRKADAIRGDLEALAAGGQVSMPLEQLPRGDYFGQLTDKFGVDWMVNITGAGAPAEG